MSKIILKNIATLYGVQQGHQPIRGNEMQDVPALQNAWVRAEHGFITDFGLMSQFPQIEDWTQLKIVDCEHRSVLPAFIDVHTHLVFAQNRSQEFRDRLKGRSYQEIAARGGGILNSANHIKQCSEDELYAAAKERLQDCIASGTCAIEIKSGYGLEWPEELKMLRVIYKLKLESAIPIKITFLAAHAIPKKWQTDTDGYVNYIITESIPQIAAQGFADYIDVFCEKGYFTPAQCARILECGINAGLKPRIHAEQLSHSGGIALGVKMHAVSVDHLEYCSDADIELLAHSKVMPVILPGAAFFLQLPSPPVRKMLQAGLPLVLASDYNPGSSPSGHMLEMMRLACITMGMQIEEAFNASTINAACTLNLQNQYGSVWPGKRMHLILTKPHWDLTRMIYEFSSNPIDEIIC